VNVERTAEEELHFGKHQTIVVNPALLAALFALGQQMDSAVLAQLVSVT
jgi:hypothetical protein